MVEIPKLIVRDIVNNAAQKMRIYPSDQPLEDDIFKNGIKILNRVLYNLNSEILLIPYRSILQFPITISKKSYTIGKELTNDVVHNKPLNINNVLVVVGNVTYPLKIISQYQNYALTKCTLSQRFPNYVFVSYAIDYTTLEFVFNPWMDGECFINAKFEIDYVQTADDEIKLPLNYAFFLEYSVARELSQIYGGWTPDKETLYKEHLASVKDYSEIDLDSRQDLFVKNNNRRLFYGWY